jgi:hypothetical protein
VVGRAHRTTATTDALRPANQEETMSTGIVTSDGSTFADMIRNSPPDIGELAVASRALLFDILPETVEVVWPRQRTAGYGTGPRKKTDQFCWITPTAHHITLGFYYGAELPDPHQLLDGTGMSMRHVKVRRMEDLHNPALRDLIHAATKHRIPQPRR